MKQIQIRFVALTVSMKKVPSTLKAISLKQHLPIWMILKLHDFLYRQDRAFK